MYKDADFPKRLQAGLVTAALVAAVGATASWAAKEELPWVAAGLGILFGIVVTFLWHWFRHTPFAPRIENSRFEFLKLVKNANKSIYLVGPCLRYIAGEQKARDMILEKLGKPNFDVWMLISKPNEPVAMVWEQVAFGRRFSDELEKSTETFRGLLNPAQRPNLKIKMTGLVTLGLVFVDMEDSDARVLVIPIPWNVAGEARPCFLLRRAQHPAAFNAYRDAYKALFTNGTLVEDLQP